MSDKESVIVYLCGMLVLTRTWPSQEKQPSGNVMLQFVLGVIQSKGWQSVVQGPPWVIVFTGVPRIPHENKDDFNVTVSYTTAVLQCKICIKMILIIGFTQCFAYIIENIFVPKLWDLWDCGIFWWQNSIKLALLMRCASFWGSLTQKCLGYCLITLKCSSDVITDSLVTFVGKVRSTSLIIHFNICFVIIMIIVVIFALYFI